MWLHNSASTSAPHLGLWARGAFLSQSRFLEVWLPHAVSDTADFSSNILGLLNPFSITLLQSCSMKLCRHSELLWSPPKETKTVLKPANSRSRTVLVSWAEGTWGTGSLFHLLSCEWHLWSPHCSVQRPGHLLHSGSLWLSPEAAVWKSPKGQ